MNESQEAFNTPVGCITRFYKGLNDEPGIRTMTVQDLMDENGGYEDSAWTYLRTIVEEGSYDDSDWGSEVFCWYMPTDGLDLIFNEAVAWYEANQDNDIHADLEHPSTWSRA